MAQQLTKERRNEIGMELLVDMLSNKGMHIGKPNLRRELGDVSKRLGIPIDELEEFSKIILVRLIGKTYGMKHVSLVMDTPYKNETGRGE